MTEAPSNETAEAEPAPSEPAPRESERDLSSLLLAVYFVGLIVVVVALLVLPAIF